MSLHATVKWFNPEKNFGFLRIDEGGNGQYFEVFVHGGDVVGNPIRDYDIVRCDVVFDKNGKKRAANVSGGTGVPGDMSRPPKPPRVVVMSEHSEMNRPGSSPMIADCDGSRGGGAAGAGVTTSRERDQHDRGNTSTRGQEGRASSDPEKNPRDGTASPHLHRSRSPPSSRNNLNKSDHIRDGERSGRGKIIQMSSCYSAFNRQTQTERVDDAPRNLYSRRHIRARNNTDPPKNKMKGSAKSDHISLAEYKDQAVREQRKKEKHNRRSRGDSRHDSRSRRRHRSHRRRDSCSRGRGSGINYHVSTSCSRHR